MASSARVARHRVEVTSGLADAGPRSSEGGLDRRAFGDRLRRTHRALVCEHADFVDRVFGELEHHRGDAGREGTEEGVSG